MLMLVLAVALAQVDPPPPMPLPDEAPPEARYTPSVKRDGPSQELRVGLGVAGGTLAGGAGLGIALLLTGQNSAFDPAFATAALSALLVAGVSFSIHQALGGNGEIILAFLTSAALMAGCTGIAFAIDAGPQITPILVAAIGSLPAAAGAILALELTTPGAKPQAPTVTLNMAANGFYGTF